MKIHSCTVVLDSNSSTTNGIIDYEPSKKYPITIEQARGRALKAIRRREEKLWKQKY